MNQDGQFNTRHNAASGTALASFTFDDLMRKRQTTFASGATNAYTYSGNRVSKWEVKPVGAKAITNNFTYDAYGHLSNTGDWAISNDTLGRIQSATSHGITTTHSHDTFGNNISHSASPTPATMINWSFPALTNNRVPTTTSSGAQTWWQYSANGEATQIGKAPGGAYIQFGWDALIEGGEQYSFEGPYRDPGERVAVDAYANGATFSDLFDQKWFDTYCKGKL